ncbi:MAG: hypothetical protein K6U14_07740 [Firmicutes bacterium]|nr:hypothetical protein [Alicyclobacillaceae bacterium]MCL6497507.1 hypothetical protein [Bacillota bacterium]
MAPTVKMRVTASATLAQAAPGAARNYDVAGAMNRWGWVVHGNPPPSGADDLPLQWLVTTLDHALRRYVTEGASAPLRMLLPELLIHVSRQYRQIWGQRSVSPVASLAVVRVEDDQVEYGVFGECFILVEDGVSGKEYRLAPTDTTRIAADQRHPLWFSASRGILRPKSHALSVILASLGLEAVWSATHGPATPHAVLAAVRAEGLHPLVARLVSRFPDPERRPAVACTYLRVDPIPTPW